jgi:poly-gamma-glutamate capsule biosynthesis protein CapA/YwtB (metallophosphatase superfamily)
MVSKTDSSLTLAAVGDISPNRDDPPSIFRYCGDVFRKADIVFGQLESPLSDRGTPMFVPHAPCRLRPDNITALTEEGAGFDIMSFACNHAMDYGWEAFFDTLDALKKNNIAVIGAGRNIAEARAPVIFERNGTKIGFLGYISVVYRGLIAFEDVPGCAPLRASHFYEQADYQPGTPPFIITKLFPEDRKAMEEDIRKLRPQVDVLVVSIHSGIHFQPVIIPMYQKEAGYAAIDAGADLVLQHHAHILKGIETYKDKVIFYSLGNFALEHALPFAGKMMHLDHTMLNLKKDLYRIRTVPGYEKHRFHHDALKTLVAKAYIQDGKIRKVTYIPTYITPNLEPEVLTRKDPRAQEVFDYIKHISDEQDLHVNFAWDGDEVLIC